MAGQSGELGLKGVFVVNKQEKHSGIGRCMSAQETPKRKSGITPGFRLAANVQLKVFF